jgi:hypothetical protein
MKYTHRFARFIYNRIPLPRIAKSNLKNWVFKIVPSWRPHYPHDFSAVTENFRKADQPQPMDHKSKLLYRISPTSQDGLEIGPLCNPTLSKVESNGRIQYVDYVTATELREKYHDEPMVCVNEIVEIDYLWGEHTLPELVGKKQFDYVIASHVIEHIPDMIGWFKEVGAVLKDKGILSLAIPDKRYTFDYLRELSTPGMLIEAYLTHRRRPGPREVFDNSALMCKVDLKAAWEGNIEKTKLERVCSLNVAYDLAKDSMYTEHYHDSHVNIFTPISFLDLLEIAIQLSLFDFVVLDFSPTTRNTLEFFTSLERVPRDENRNECIKRQLDSISQAKKCA